jgi:transcriptional regulator with XRE-family HTH domain
MKLSSYLERETLAVEQFAEQVGVDPASVRRYLRGDRRPRGRVMERIIEVTGGSVTPNDFWQVKWRKKPQAEPEPSDEVQPGPSCAAA